MLRFFGSRWDSIPYVFIDTETTGTRPGKDKAVQVAIVRFEKRVPVAHFSSLVIPIGVAISAEATAVHGITDADVVDAPSIEGVFHLPEVKALLQDAQPGAYNAAFDRHFVPPFSEDWTWPWADSLSIVRLVDRYERGKGRHKLAAACQRHGIPAWQAHDAKGDATASGQLFFKLGPQIFDQGTPWSLGQVLRWQRVQEAEEFYRFSDWLSKQPPREAQANG
jgi:DNA polymerase-3 subunit epsilon